MAVDKTDTLVEYEGHVFHWRYCAALGCENRVCVNISEHFCFVHAEGNEHVKRMKIDAARVAALR
jgi:hypothetical protein